MFAFFTYHQQIRAYLLSLTAILALALTLFSGIGSGVAHAAPSASSVSSSHHHDLSHPAIVNLPCPGASRSGVGPQPVVSSCSTSTSGKQGITPLANSPIGQYCANGVGYKQGENGAYGWSATQDNLTVYVEYWWCPVNSSYSSQYPNGINWSYGTVHDAASSGCVWARVGEWAGGGSTNLFYLGGVINGSGWEYDGEQNNAFIDTTYNPNITPTPPTYSICAGNPNSYIWDYSQPGTGSDTYKAEFSSGVETYNSSVGHYYLTQYADVKSPNQQ